MELTPTENVAHKQEAICSPLIIVNARYDLTQLIITSYINRFMQHIKLCRNLASQIGNELSGHLKRCVVFGYLIFGYLSLTVTGRSVVFKTRTDTHTQEHTFIVFFFENLRAVHLNDITCLLSESQSAVACSWIIYSCMWNFVNFSRLLFCTELATFKNISLRMEWRKNQATIHNICIDRK